MYLFEVGLFVYLDSKGQVPYPAMLTLAHSRMQSRQK